MIGWNNEQKLEPILFNQQTEAFVVTDSSRLELLSVTATVSKKSSVKEVWRLYILYKMRFWMKKALKVLHLEKWTHRYERTKVEFRMMKSLDHPNIPAPMYSLDVLNDGRVTLSMPPMRGTLKDLASIRSITQEQIEKWTIQTLSALNYLHRKDPPIYHRDIKPSNLLYDEHENVVF